MANCGAPTSSGGACKKPAGYRTRHPGKGRCYFHELTNPIFPFSHPSKKIRGSGICRSPIELESFKKLDLTRQVDYYETEPFGIPYSYLGFATTYIPDILVTYKDGRKVLLEIKSQSVVDAPENRAKFRAALKYARENDMEFRLWVYDSPEKLRREIWTMDRLVAHLSQTS